MAEINVVPYIDVMLVLLIIFMVTAPMLQQGIDVDLPETTTQNLRVREELGKIYSEGDLILTRESADRWLALLKQWRAG